MHRIRLKNGKTFLCDENATIFDAAKSSGILLEHSCLTARCRSCVVRIIEGSTKDKLDDMVLTELEKETQALSCNAIPTSDLLLDIEDLGNIIFYEKKIVPAKIQSIDKLIPDVIKVTLRLPPNVNFAYNAGQYVNLIRGQTKRSYSIANSFKEENSLCFFIKNYENGEMSRYWFNEAKENDLIRLEGPLGSFFLRETDKTNIILLATGTGIAPIKAILEKVKEQFGNYQNKIFWLFFGARTEKDIFWVPNSIEFVNLKFVKALSRELINSDCYIGYVQNAMINLNIDLTDAQVYACGSSFMIESARRLCIENGLPENEFFSDAFICTN
ncbi:FAD-binding oxidoreductase [Sediminibacterium sp.]|uniref:FAD-binding oxidoreductase n=1 Tax=Sediminibacterium sp. TaxID=1917865 RepID=UPI0027307BE9|nr:FAD-binding oxidoreductase [Sediminibacterium sp.]MDP2420237.1 FAD-binding oxidoreductase [Sediminibacterium sp.]